MAVAVLAVKLALVGHLHPSLLLAAEVIVGLVVYAAALFVFERDLMREVLTIALQAVPAGERISRLLHLPTGQGRQRRQERRAAQIARAESREADLDMDIAADLGAEEARTADI